MKAVSDAYVKPEHPDFAFYYHVPNQWPQGGGSPPLLLTVEGMTEEVADYMGRAHLCDMATLGHRLHTAPGRRGRLARWLVGDK